MELEVGTSQGAGVERQASFCLEEVFLCAHVFPGAPAEWHPYGEALCIYHYAGNA